VAKAELARLPGLGDTTAQWLVDVGIESYDDIDRLGSIEVYRLLQRSRPGVTLNFLWALESLLLGCHWRDLPAQRKDELRRQVGGHDDRRA
jgi:DNA transformation protein